MKIVGNIIPTYQIKKEQLKKNIPTFTQSIFSKEKSKREIAYTTSGYIKVWDIGEVLSKEDEVKTNKRNYI